VDQAPSRLTRSDITPNNSRQNSICANFLGGMMNSFELLATHARTATWSRVSAKCRPNIRVGI
jgi:hypothetical protein